MKWIKCSDQLPDLKGKTYRNVIVYGDYSAAFNNFPCDGIIFGGAFFRDNKFYMDYGDGEREIEVVSHWMHSKHQLFI